MRSNQLNYVPLRLSKRLAIGGGGNRLLPIKPCQVLTAYCRVILVGGIRLERMTFCL